MSNRGYTCTGKSLLSLSCRRRSASRILNTPDQCIHRHDKEVTSQLFRHTRIWYRFRYLLVRVMPVIACVMCTAPVLADKPVFKLEISNHLFMPSKLVIPANTKIKLMVHNLDNTSEEFESYELNREKVIMGNRKAVIFIGPLVPGEYPFFGEFHPETAQGIIIAE